ncbi:hypothetical protein [Leucobacter chromiiresistens]|uniref:Uncharacterized protein n=1 Tax=Leucobacter chromiiresistens TaxID=1079994 RepID=A0A1H0XQQ9_9MICO|nr:hypothetical protein [Leucobacter chromiiresistens]SDQ04794.1 hypothetical protein SAMN04488565_0007 [Leucobacter chromiiresistens]SDQ05244.1 hypothetical protein SAMN04488565_0061 [Leucobacter chromiiresistens]
MAGGVEHRPGGILALCRLIDRHEDAIEYDLLNAGYSLDDLGHSLSWRHLWVLTRRWQTLPGTATCAAVQGREHWGVAEQLLAEIIDLLNIGNWQRAGRKHAAKPKRFPRPWEKAKAQKLGSDPIPVSKFSDWWDSFTDKKKRRNRR